MAQRVFISHSSHDKEMANTVCKFLEERGIACWIAPRNVPPGAKYGETIVNAIEDALAMVFIFSEHSNNSEQVMNEIERSVSKKKPIFPLKIGSMRPSSELEYFISRRHWLDLSITPLETTLPQLADALHSLAATEAPAAMRGARTAQQPEQLFVLEASREGERLKLSAHERTTDEERPLQHYEYLDISFEAVEHVVESLIVLLNRATNSHGTLEAATWQEIKDYGEILYNRILPPGIQKQLKESTATNLLLHIDDALVQIPWELLFDGETFLCRRFSIGRLVRTQQAPVERQERKQGQKLTMLVIADPQGNLEAAAQEGDTLLSELAPEGQRLQVDLRKTTVDTATVTAALAQCDLLHYAGHADYNPSEPAQSGWLLGNGKLTAAEILHIGATGPMPMLVFCNACQSGQTPAWQITQGAAQDVYGLANAFLLAGTQHYIGSLWEIPDQPSRTFAIEFYRALAGGATIGAALRGARQRLIERYGEDSVVWASYMLYGDPTSRYLEAAREQPALRQEGLSAPTVTPSKSAPRTRRRMPLLVGASAVAVVAILVLALGFGGRLWQGTASDTAPLTLAYQALERGDPVEAEGLFKPLVARAEKGLKGQGYTGLAAVAFVRNDYPQTLDFAGQAETLDPEIVYSHVLRAHILLHQGNTAEAAAEYRMATAKTHGLPWQYAIAYNRLGRLYTAEGHTQQALESYDKALNQPANGHINTAIAYTNKGHLLEQLGQHREALALYRQAQQLSPDDRLTASLLREAERRAQLTQDQEKQERVDRLVTELLQLHRDGRPRQDQSDGWTSMPLTLAVLPLQIRGALSPRAGEEDFLFLRLVDTLQATGRITIVEREILDKILTELKLSAAELVDPQVAVRVGRILAARLLTTGSLARLGAEVQMSLRVVETESTRLKAAVTEIFALPLGIDRVADQLSATLLQKLRAAYPLQGRLAQVTSEGVVLNIGAEQGVTAGLRLEVLGADEPINLEGRVVGYNQPRVGLIEVTSTHDRFAQAKVLEQTVPFAQGWKAKEVQGQ